MQIFRELTHKTGNVQESIYSVAKSKVVGFGENFDTVREISLATDCLLEGSTCSAPAVNFSIKKTFDDKSGRKHFNMRLHDLRRISSRETPYYVTCSIAHV